ncbi:MAG: hypothetical protein Q9166_007647 [cf. Caloplaca sp. 2 TL-2023]
MSDSVANFHQDIEDLETIVDSRGQAPRTSDQYKKLGGLIERLSHYLKDQHLKHPARTSLPQRAYLHLGKIFPSLRDIPIARRNVATILVDQLDREDKCPSEQEPNSKQAKIRRQVLEIWKAMRAGSIVDAALGEAILDTFLMADDFFASPGKSEVPAGEPSS